MVYILPLVLCYGLFLRYDLNSNKRGEKLWYYLLLFIFIAISGFAYNIGADTPGYMYEFDSYQWRFFHRLSDLNDVYHRQPGWVLTMLFCKLFSSEYLFFQLVTSTFINTVIFLFIRKHCDYPFLGIFFYAIVLYLQLNFNALRQAYAICFFFLGYNYLIEKKYIKYYLFALLAFSFHVSAALIFIIPLLSFIKLNRNIIILFGSLLLVLVYAVMHMDLNVYFSAMFADMLMEEGTMQNVGELGEKFLSSRYERDESTNLFGIIEIILGVVFMVFVTVYSYLHNKKGNNFWNGMLLIYCACGLLDYVVPVLFYRAKEYFEIIYYCSLAFCVVDFGNRFFKNKLIIAAISLLFIITPIKAILAINPSSGIPLIRQFYPYYSVFDKKTDPVRASNFGSHK